MLRNLKQRLCYTQVFAALGLAFGAAASGRALAQVPGPELFAIDPRTPLELWSAIDYLTRTGQSEKAVLYLERFSKAQVDDSTWIAIRDRYGAGSILRLSDNAATAKYAEPLVTAFTASMRKVARSPERVARFMKELTGGPVERDFGARHLREAGSHAAPQIAQELARTDLAADARASLLFGLGQLDRSAIPGLATLLEASNPMIAASAAQILGSIGSSAALPYLAYPAAAGANPQLKMAAQAAIARITGRPYASQKQTSAQILTAAAWSYHRHQATFEDDPPLLWMWDAQTQAPQAQEMSRSEAEAMIGGRFAQEALRLDPKNHDARVAAVSIMLDKAVEKTGRLDFATKNAAAFNAAKASGPAVLSDVLKTAIADGRGDLAAVSAQALGAVSRRDQLTGRRMHPLAEALLASERPTQFAAAKALVELGPTARFPGSSLVVPTLARFLVHQPKPRAVVIDSNPSRGSQLAGLLVDLDYDSELEVNPEIGFRAAAGSANVDLVLVSYDLFRPGWKLPDTLTNFHADARTKGIPLYVYGPIDLPIKRPNIGHDYPGIRYLVQPLEAGSLRRQLRVLPRTLTEAERQAYARESQALLGRIAADRKSPFASDLSRIEPILAAAAGAPGATPPLATALGATPSPDAQRALADVVLDRSRNEAFRKAAVESLVASIERFGPLVSAEQESRLADLAKTSTDGDPSFARVMAALERRQAQAPATGARR